MDTSKYMPPKDEDMHLITLPSSKRMKKEHRQFIVFKKNKRIFFNISLLRGSSVMCYLCDGVPTIKYDEKSPSFIDVQWAIDEKIGGELCIQLGRIQKELSEREDLWKEYGADHIELEGIKK